MMELGWVSKKVVMMGRRTDCELVQMTMSLLVTLMDVAIVFVKVPNSVEVKEAVPMAENSAWLDH
jgi:hypothetical protein